MYDCVKISGKTGHCNSVWKQMFCQIYQFVCENLKNYHNFIIIIIIFYIIYFPIYLYIHDQKVYAPVCCLASWWSQKLITKPKEWALRLCTLFQLKTMTSVLEVLILIPAPLHLAATCPSASLPLSLNEANFPSATIEM